MDEVLKPFIDDLKKLLSNVRINLHDIITILKQEQGVEFAIQGTPKLIYGTLAIVSADNLGSLVFGGF